MTIELCERHGRQAVVGVCRHVAAQVASGTLGPTRTTLTFVMCEACFASHPAHALLEGITFDDVIGRRDLGAAWEESAANLPGHVPCFSVCLREASSVDRRGGRPETKSNGEV